MLLNHRQHNLHPLYYYHHHHHSSYSTTTPPLFFLLPLLLDYLPPLPALLPYIACDVCEFWMENLLDIVKTEREKAESQHAKVEVVVVVVVVR